MILMPKQFREVWEDTTFGLCNEFLKEFKKSYVRLCLDNFFLSVELLNHCSKNGVYVFGTTRAMRVNRFFVEDHGCKGVHKFINTKSNTEHTLSAFTNTIFNDSHRKRVNLLIYNIPNKNAVLFNNI